MLISVKENDLILYKSMFLNYHFSKYNDMDVLDCVIITGRETTFEDIKQYININNKRKFNYWIWHPTSEPNILATDLSHSIKEIIIYNVDDNTREHVMNRISFSNRLRDIRKERHIKIIEG